MIDVELCGLIELLNDYNVDDFHTECDCTPDRMRANSSMSRVCFFISSAAGPQLGLLIFRVDYGL